MKYYVFCVDTYDGGRFETFETEKEARDFVASSSKGDLNYIVKGELLYEE